jgi:hypothetical protein
MIEESAPPGEATGNPPAGWPGREDTREFEQSADADPRQLRKVSGGFDWVDPSLQT